MDDFSQVWNIDYNNGKESLFEIQTSDDTQYSLGERYSCLLYTSEGSVLVGIDGIMTIQVGNSTSVATFHLDVCSNNWFVVAVHDITPQYERSERESDG